MSFYRQSASLLINDGVHVLLVAGNDDDGSFEAVTGVAMTFLRLNESYLEKRYGLALRPTDRTYTIDMDIPAFWVSLSGGSCGAAIIGTWWNRETVVIQR